MPYRIWQFCVSNVMAKLRLPGGFGRRLDAEQVTLYRDDWHSIVASRRVQLSRDARDQIPEGQDRIRYMTSLIERLQDSSDYITLASTYNDLDNDELRDKYIEKALAIDSPDWLVIYLRSMQGRRDLIPRDVADRRLAQQADWKEWHNRARTLVKLGEYVDAARDYVRGVLRSLETGRTFGAAYYLKELYKEGIIDKLFEHALQQAADRDDLWWQVRALQELGWHSEIDELVLANEERIKSPDDPDPFLLALLYSAKGDQRAADRIMVEVFGSVRHQGERIGIPSLTEEFRKSLDKSDAVESEPPDRDRRQ